MCVCGIEIELRTDLNLSANDSVRSFRAPTTNFINWIIYKFAKKTAIRFVSSSYFYPFASTRSLYCSRHSSVAIYCERKSNYSNRLCSTEIFHIFMGYTYVCRLHCNENILILIHVACQRLRDVYFIARTYVEINWIWLHAVVSEGHLRIVANLQLGTATGAGRMPPLRRLCNNLAEKSTTTPACVGCMNINFRVVFDSTFWGMHQSVRTITSQLNTRQ